MQCHAAAGEVRVKIQSRLRRTKYGRIPVLRYVRDGVLSTEISRYRASLVAARRQWQRQLLLWHSGGQVLHDAIWWSGDKLPAGF